MKKLDKIDIGSYLLNNEELKLLKGGSFVDNLNRQAGCSCTYNNASYTTNTNTVSYCACNCTRG